MISHPEKIAEYGDLPRFEHTSCNVGSKIVNLRLNPQNE